MGGSDIELGMVKRIKSESGETYLISDGITRVEGE